ncbi:15529_t:CDS:2 [Entrophospora sp. SA101]|nr:15529_t:CDS:2 [Entrophospora sp. SA101]
MSKLPNKKNNSSQENNDQSNEPDKKDNADKEIEAEIANSQNELQNIKKQIANTDSPAKKNELEKEINGLENHIKDLKKKRNQKNFTKTTASPQGAAKTIIIKMPYIGKMIFTKKIKSLGELEKLSKLLIPFLQPNVYLVLQGELGVGKTTLTQLLAKNLEIKEKVTSPTFTICQRYQIKDNYYLNHFDFFRLNTNDNLEIFQEQAIDNLNIIE